jgi:hypothetical protein
MRKYWPRGHNHTYNQIIVRSDSYTTFQLSGRAWIKIPGLIPGKRIAISLDTTVEPTGTLRLILRDDKIEVHYTIEVAETKNCGTETLGIDEDLTAPISGKKFNKDVNRRLASWTKGVIAEAIDNVSQRRGSTLFLVNPAYTSQMDSRNGGLIGNRNGNRFHCFDGVVLQADENAARNVLARLFDPEIDRWMSFKKVKAILLERTERLRLGLLNQDSSCKPRDGLSTESEVLNGTDVHDCPCF